MVRVVDEEAGRAVVGAALGAVVATGGVLVGKGGGAFVVVVDAGGAEVAGVPPPVLRTTVASWACWLGFIVTSIVFWPVVPGG